jgi:hypothetical protein
MWHTSDRSNREVEEKIVKGILSSAARSSADASMACTQHKVAETTQIRVVK